MKISYRILFINFFVVALIIGSASFAFYSIMYNVLTSQQSKYLLDSSSDFLLAYKETFQSTEDNFNRLSRSELSLLFSERKVELQGIDFILEREAKDSKFFTKSVIKEGVNLPQLKSSLTEFIKNNPSAVVRSQTFPDGFSVYYGKLLTDDFLNSIAQKINAQVAIISGNTTLQVSNQSLNQEYIYFLNKAYKKLSREKSFHIYSEDSEKADIISTLCNVSSDINENQNLHFLIFSTLNEAADLRSSIKYLLVIVGVSGIVLSLILTFIFTQRIRSQLKLLSNATELTKKGNFKNKIEIKSRDEIGHLASAFNGMLDELDKHDKAITEYTDFLALINRNASLKEIADAALNKIIKTCGFTVGAIYAVKNSSISLIRSLGIKGKTSVEDFEFFDSAIKNREMLELNFDKNFPTISAGIISLEIKHMLIIPIIYNNEVIALIELGGLEKPSQEVKNYLSKIQEQLAIGLTNAFGFVQLENLVVELRLLNEEYQKQNAQVKMQNESLIELHNQLKTKAEELEIQKHKAEESTKLKSQFLASMSHELRTPMNSVLGLTELILEETDSLNSKTKERLEIVHRNGKRLMNLINDILDLSKIEAGKMELKSDDILLEDIIFDVDASIKPLVVRKHLNLKIVRKINTNIVISTDRGKVTQVLINLLGNAIKFTEKGSVELHIESVNENKLKFNVIDSGIGISAEDQTIIFEEFRQIDGTSTRKYSGTGLGLSICKKIAEMLNGSLSLESQPGKGSIFTFTIPYNISAEKKEKKHFINIEVLRRNRKNPILIIDDDADIRLTIGEYLISRDYNVVYSDSGENVLEFAKQLQPFAITLDVLLPKKDGWTILKELKAEPSTKDIPVILVSIINDKDLGYELGAFEHFTKPVSQADLDSIFNKLENHARKKSEKIDFIDTNDLGIQASEGKILLPDEKPNPNNPFGEILIVDDDPDTLFTITEIVKSCNCKTLNAKNGLECISVLEENLPDLILLDIMMPEMDGFQTIKKIRENADWKHIPVFAVTARAMLEDRQIILKNGFDDYITKPVNTGVISFKIEKLFSKIKTI